MVKRRLTYSTTPSGRRVYHEASSEHTTSDSKEKGCYCRASSAKQRDDLERQAELCRARFPEHRIIRDIGSGLNYKGKGLKELVDLAERGNLEEFVVTHRDGLARFSFEFFAWFFSKHGTKILVLDSTMDQASESELCKDIFSIITVFLCRLYGRRRYKSRGQGASITDSQTQTHSTAEVEPSQTVW